MSNPENNRERSYKKERVSYWRMKLQRLQMAWKALTQDRIIMANVRVKHTNPKEPQEIEVATELEIVGLPHHVALDVLRNVTRSLEQENSERQMPAELRAILDNLKGKMSSLPSGDSTSTNPFLQ